MMVRIDLPDDVLEKLKDVGIETDTSRRAGTYVHANHTSVTSEVNESLKEDIEIIDIRKALEKYDWLKEYWWKAVDKDKDEFTKLTDEKLGGGYFIWVKKGAQVSVPIQSCMFIQEENFKQIVHNVVIVEEGARVNILTGCLTHPNIHTAEHIGISEFYVKKDAYLNFTMIHEWTDNSFVRPRSAAIVEDDGHFVSNYIVLNPVRDIQMYPRTMLKGEKSKATLTSLLYGQKESLLDIGGRIDLIGKGSQGQIISRAITTDKATIIARGMIVGEQKDSKAHLECQGLLLSDTSIMHAIPELIAKKEGTELSHEAAVGKISQEEIIYLMSRGLSEQEATDIIVRGFLDIKILGLPDEFEERVQNLINRVGDEGM